MFKLLMNLDLSPQRLFHFRSLDHPLVQLLNRYFDAAGLVQRQLDGAVRALAQLPIFKLKLIQRHIRQHLLIRAVRLACNPQLACLDEGCGLLDASDLLRVQTGHDLAAVGVLVPRALVLVPQLPVLIQAMVRAVDEIGHFGCGCGICRRCICGGAARPPINYVGDVRRALLAGKERHVRVLLLQLQARLVLVPVDALWIAALLAQVRNRSSVHIFGWCHHGGLCGTALLLLLLGALSS